MTENYNVPFEQAKEMEKYEFHKSENVNTREKLIDFISLNSLCNNDGIISRNQEFDMYFGSLSIESEIFYDKSDNAFCISYFVVIKYEGGEWFSEDYSDGGIDGNLNDIESIITEDVYNSIEEKMYNSMMKFAEEKKLCWSKENSDFD